MPAHPRALAVALWLWTGAASAAPAQDLKSAVRLYEAYEFEKALALLDKLARSEPPRLILAKARLYMGLCQFNLGDADAGRLQFTSALSMDPSLRLPPGTAPKIAAVFNEVRAGSPRPRRTKPPGPEPSVGPPPVPAPEPASDSAGGAPEVPTAVVPSPPPPADSQLTFAPPPAPPVDPALSEPPRPDSPHVSSPGLPTASAPARADASPRIVRVRRGLGPGFWIATTTASVAVLGGLFSVALAVGAESASQRPRATVLGWTGLGLLAAGAVGAGVAIYLFVARDDMVEMRLALTASPGGLSFAARF